MMATTIQLGNKVIDCGWNMQEVFYLCAFHLPPSPILSKGLWVQWHDLKWLELLLTYLEIAKQVLQGFIDHLSQQLLKAPFPMIV